MSPIWARLTCEFYRFRSSELPDGWVAFQRRDLLRLGLPVP
jgi:hypothetical protein